MQAKVIQNGKDIIIFKRRLLNNSRLMQTYVCNYIDRCTSTENALFERCCLITGNVWPDFP